MTASHPDIIDTCPCCSGAWRKHRTDWLRRCRSCGLLSSTLDPCIPSVATASPIDEPARARGLATTRMHNHALILQSIQRVTGRSSGALLDVGCGHGMFLADAARAGYQVFGVEPDANVVHRARQVTGASIAHGFFPNAIDAALRFDVITFNDVLEHLPEPRSAVAIAATMLKPGGVLVLNCPSRNGLFYRLSTALHGIGWGSPFRRMWQYGLPSPHLWYFTPQDLTALGRAQSLKMVGLVPLLTLSTEGLKDRIGYVTDQPRALTVLTTAAIWALIPLTRLAPADVCAVLFQRT